MYEALYELRCSYIDNMMKPVGLGSCWSYFNIGLARNLLLCIPPAMVLLQNMYQRRLSITLPLGLPISRHYPCILAVAIGAAEEVDYILSHTMEQGSQWAFIISYGELQTQVRVFKMFKIFTEGKACGFVRQRELCVEGVL